MLRAEKLELEDEYFLLKSRYDTAVAQLAHRGVPAPAATGPAIIPAQPPIQNDSGFESLDDEIIIEAPEVRSSPGHGDLPSSDVVDDPELAQYIESVEVDQLASANSSNGLKLLIRPLDGQGAVIPMAGDLVVRVLEQSKNRRQQLVKTWTFRRNRVASWIQDQPNQLPGIHLNLPWNEQARRDGKLLLDLKFRTADNRLISRQSEIVTEGPAEAEEFHSVVVELGDETATVSRDVENASAGRPRPRWQPTR